MTAYILHSLVWSLAGFALGWVLGRLGAEVHRIGDTLMPEHSRPRKFTAEHVVGVVIVVLAVLTMATSVATTQNLQAVTACQERWNASYRDALSERTDSTANVRAAQAEWLAAATATGDLDAPEVRDALDRYRIALERDNQSRLENPINARTRCP